MSEVKNRLKTVLGSYDGWNEIALTLTLKELEH